jgi:hypothetical protein
MGRFDKLGEPSTGGAPDISTDIEFSRFKTLFKRRLAVIRRVKTLVRRKGGIKKHRKDDSCSPPTTGATVEAVLE